MSNAFFYTMATVAASLGSAMALLAAFTLYRLTSISVDMSADALRVADGIGGVDRGPMLFASSLGDWDNYFRLVQTAFARYEHPERDIDVTVRAMMQRLRDHARRAHRLLRALWVALSLTAVVMTGAVVALAAADRLQRCSSLGTVVPWLGVLGFVTCLISYLVLIWLALSRASDA